MPYLGHKHLIYDPNSGRLIYDPTSGHLIKAGEQDLKAIWTERYQKKGTSTVSKADAIANMEADAWTGADGYFASASQFGSRWTFWMVALRFDTDATGDGGALGQYYIPEGESASIVFINVTTNAGVRPFRMGFATTASGTPVTAWSWVTSAPYMIGATSGLQRLEFPSLTLERYFWIFLYFNDASAAQNNDIYELTQTSGSYGRIVG